MRILILQLKRIGDAILTTPVLSVLRRERPHAHLTLALDGAGAGLAPAVEADAVLVRGSDFWRPLATGKFDVVLDLTGNDRSALATVVSRASRRITWTRFAGKPLRRAIYTDFVESSVRDRHTVDHHLDLLRALDITAENELPALVLSDDARAAARAALTRAGVEGPYVVVHPGTARAEKYWQPERWAEVILHLRRELGLAVVLTGSSDEAERAHVAAIQRALPSPAPDLGGQLSLLGTAAVLAGASLVCAVDSAPVHLADALDVPVVALFGPTNPFHWRPRRATSRLVTASGEPRMHPGYPKGPMDQISVAAVGLAIADLKIS